MKPTHAKDESLLRLLIMVLFAVVLNISISVIMLIGFVQWIIRFIRNDEIIRLKEFSSSLNEFNYQIGQFFTLNTEQKPFPFSDWPTPESAELSEYDQQEEKTQAKPEEAQSKPENDETPKEKSNLKPMQNSELSSNASILDQDLTDDEQLDSIKESDS